MKFYALQAKILRNKNERTFFCISFDPETFKKNIQKAFFNRKGLLPRGKVFTMADFLLDFNQVFVTVDAVSSHNKLAFATVMENEVVDKVKAYEPIK